MQDNQDYSEYRERLTNFSNEFDLGLFLHILRKSLPWLISFLVLSSIAAFLYLRYTPDVYEAKAILQLGEDDSANRVLNVNQMVNDNGLEGRVELMRSKLLVQNTLGVIPMEISYFAKGRVLTNEHYILSPYRVEIIEIENNQMLNKPVIVEFNEDQTFTLKAAGQVLENNTFNQPIELPGVQLRLVLIDNQQILDLKTNNELYFRINSLSTLANRFSNSLDVRVLNNTAKTVQISFQDNNPYLARDFVQALSNEFIRFDLEKRQRSDENILAFIDSQIDTVFQNLRNSESLLNNYKQDNKISNLESLSGVYLTRLSEIENRVIQLEVEEKLLNQVRGLTSDQTENIEVYNLVPLVAGSQFESSLSGLLNNLYNLLLKKEEALFTVTSESDIVKSYEYQIRIQKTLIVETIDALRSKLVERKDENYKKLKEVEEVYFQLPTKELEFARLERLFNINEKYYTMLLEKRIEYRISKEGFVTQNQILDDVRLPQVPVSPKRNIIFISFLMAGIILGFIYISLRYLLHNQVTSLNEIVRMSNASISTLGVIPRYKENIPISMLLVDKNPKSMIAESFRSVRTNLQYIDNSPGTKIAAVTSTISGEGKTFIALNLSGIVAFSGKKVIVLDLDMRKPKIHKAFDVGNTRGMSTLLIGESSIEECINHSPMGSLDFITAGPIPPNPSELIISPRMDEILEELKGKYDMIILDTPPVGLVTDGIAMIQKADYPLYIFRADYSKKQFVQNVDRLINENKISKLAVVLNGVDLDRNKYAYSYGYGYGYGYGVGYGYYEEVNSRRKGRRK